MYLVGRILVFKLLPFSLREVVRAKNKRLETIYASNKYGQEILEKLNNILKEYLLYGGYPRVVLSKSKKEKETVLNNLFSTYLLREIKDILQLSSNDQLIKLIKSLSLQTGNLINYNELSSITGLTYKELIKFLYILEQTYVCNRVSTFYSNKRTELFKTPKIYFIDTGFRNVCISNFNQERTDKGALYENITYTELVKKGHTPKYWRTKSGAEVDEVLDKKNITPIEVKTSLKQKKLTRSFQSFLKKYKPTKSYILSKTLEAKNKKNLFLPFTKFFNKKQI
jgi:hypothetical protein